MREIAETRRESTVKIDSRSGKGNIALVSHIRYCSTVAKLWQNYPVGPCLIGSSPISAPLYVIVKKLMELDRDL